MQLRFGKQVSDRACHNCGNHPCSCRPKDGLLKPFFRAAVQPDGTLEMLIYEEIGYDWWSGGGITAKTIKEQIDSAGVYSKIVLRINSAGGDAFEGIAIHNLLRSQGKPIEAYVDGLAASSASIIAMAGDQIIMGRSALMMVHNAWSFCMGYAEDMRKMADTLEKISSSIGQVYVEKTGKSAEEIQSLMDEETWMNAEECVAEGFATGLAEEPEEPAALALAKQFPILAKFKKRPDGSRNEEKTKPVPAPAPKAGSDMECSCACEACMDGDCDKCALEDCDDAACKEIGCPMQADAAAQTDLSLYDARARLAALKASGSKPVPAPHQATA